MSQILPYMNPIRFHKNSTEIDYIDTLPTFDLMKMRVEYQRNVYPADYYPIFQINKEISLQFPLERAEIRSATLLLNNSIDSFPTYVSVDSLSTNITTTITKIGVYYFFISFKIDGVFTTFSSDKFKVVNWVDKKDLIKINYSDTNNDNGGRFYNSDGDAIWEPTAYYHGRIDKEPTQYNRSVFTSQTNNQQVIRSTPKLVDKITISCIHEAYYDNLSYQLTCNTIYVNDVQYAVESVGKFDKIAPESDIGNVEIIISRNSNNNYQQFL